MLASGMTPKDSVPIVVSARGRAPIIPVAVILTPLLILRRDRSGRVTQTVAAIDIGAIAAWNGVAAATVVARILPCRLLLRRQVAVRVAKTIACAQIPAVAAWRRMGEDPVLHGLRQDTRYSSPGRHAQLGGQCCCGNADDHGPSPTYWKQGFRDTLAGGPMAIVESLLHPSKHIKMRAECPVNAFIPIAPSCYRIL